MFPLDPKNPMPDILFCTRPYAFRAVRRRRQEFSGTDLKDDLSDQDKAKTD
jgi:hypothetical protein